jgi:hypothetical protein
MVVPSGLSPIRKLFSRLVAKSDLWAARKRRFAEIADNDAMKALQRGFA